MSSIYDIAVRTLDGKDQTLDAYRDKVLLIVNVASRCGFTPQYTGLEALWKQYQARGLVVLGFPCNQFGAQEPGDAAEIARFCSLTYDVSFPMFAKVDVNGSNTHPLFEHLKAAAPGLLGIEMIKWNFTKFLVSRDGGTVMRFAPNTSPMEMSSDVENLLVA
jgi:glutathione peroxidase